MFAGLRAAAHLYQFIRLHPIGRRDFAGSIERVLRWQLTSRLAPSDVTLPFVDGTRLLVRRSMTGATGNYYVGLHEFAEMALILHALREGDLFCDVGSNIGSYTVLASGVTGARTVAFEPVPATFSALLANVALNRLDGLVRTVQKGVGAEPGSLRFTSGLDSVNHVVASDEHVAGEVIDVPVTTLDHALAGECPSVMKIDVEGFEPWVLRGATATLANDALKAIVIETNGSSSRYYVSDDECHAALLHSGFAPYRYDGLARRLHMLDGPAKGGNTIYVRDVAWIEERVRQARVINVHGVRV